MLFRFFYFHLCSRPQLFCQVPLRISFCVETLYFPSTVGSDVILQLGWVNSEYCQSMSDCGSEMTYFGQCVTYQCSRAQWGVGVENYGKHALGVP